MVHQTISTRMTSAPSASSNNKVMPGILESPPFTPWGPRAWRATALLAMTLGLLAGCASPGRAPVSAPLPEPPHTSSPADSPPLAVSDPEALAELNDALLWAASQPAPAPLTRPRSQWLPAAWTDLPGLHSDLAAADWSTAWNAWVRSCERPASAWPTLCRQVRPLMLAAPASQLAWMVRHLQPYRVAASDGSLPSGLLTGYYEPELRASRVRSASHPVPLYAPPAGLNGQQPWFSRQDIDSRPDVQAQLAGREIVWLADPIDALIVQIQGSGRVKVTEPDGSERTVRLAFAGHNGHPYRSVGRWLLDRRAITDASWPAIKAWAARNPDQLNDMLWSNPRTVFFREEPLGPLDAAFGPRGAQGVPLTPQRSIAVDPGAIPYGTPVWLASPGPTAVLQRLVLAQDTGAAITGAARADYFAGWGDEALAIAGGLKQPLQLWALWPRAGVGAP
ncbi:murein transglycosylase A [Hydrogenophaga soli]|nr:MltA domain-containing protein [Burkholderiaceae bacterium]